MKRKCEKCIHIGHSQYCLKNPELSHEVEGCDDFWPEYPTCAECRFYDVQNGGACLDKIIVTETQTIAARMNPYEWCPSWRCRVQS